MYLIFDVINVDVPTNQVRIIEYNLIRSQMSVKGTKYLSIPDVILC